MSSALRKLSVDSLRDTHGRHVNIGVMRVSTDIPTRVVMRRKTLKIHSVWELKLPLMSPEGRNGTLVKNATGKKIFQKQNKELTMNAGKALTVLATVIVGGGVVFFSVATYYAVVALVHAERPPIQANLAELAGMMCALAGGFMLKTVVKANKA